MTQDPWATMLFASSGEMRFGDETPVAPRGWAAETSVRPRPGAAFAAATVLARASVATTVAMGHRRRRRDSDALSSDWGRGMDTLLPPVPRPCEPSRPHPVAPPSGCAANINGP